MDKFRKFQFRLKVRKKGNIASLITRCEQALLTEVQSLGLGGVSPKDLELPEVPQFDFPVHAGCCHEVAAGMEGEGGDRAVVAQHSDQGLHAGGLPHGHFAAGVAQPDHSVVWVRPHHVGPAQPGSVVGDYLACAYVLVVKLRKAVYRYEKEVLV